MFRLSMGRVRESSRGMGSRAGVVSCMSAPGAAASVPPRDTCCRSSKRAVSVSSPNNARVAPTASKGRGARVPMSAENPLQGQRASSRTDPTIPASRGFRHRYRTTEMRSASLPHDPRAKAILKQIAPAVMAQVEGQGVPGVEPRHQSRQAHEAALHGQVNVVGHQNRSEQRNASSGTRRSRRSRKSRRSSTPRKILRPSMPRIIT